VREFNVSDKILDKASKAATGRPYNARTIKNDGDGQVVGYIGEAVTWMFFRELFAPEEIEHVGRECFDRDFDVAGVRIDTKFCLRTVAPQWRYSGYVEAKSFRQHRPHVYVMGSYNERAGVAHIVGWLRRAEYEDRCRFVLAGEFDDGKVTPADCYKVSYSDLHLPDVLLEKLERRLYQLAFDSAG